MRSSKRFFWIREPRPPEIARCSGIRRFIPSIVTMESKMPPSAGRSNAGGLPDRKRRISRIRRLIRRLYEAISSLSPMQARRVHARYMLGMKVKDIAAMEGITPSQAGKSIHAALRRLRRYFARQKWTVNL